MFVGDTPVSVAVNPAGTRIYVVNMFSNDITVIDAESHGIVGTIDLTIGSPCGWFCDSRLALRLTPPAIGPTSPIRTA